MTTRRTISLLLIILFSMLIATSAAAETDVPPEQAGVNADLPYKNYLPVIYNPYNETIIINHNNIDINQIPDYWLGEAKKLAFHFAHTSHGSQIITGLDKLNALNPTKYTFRNWYLWEWKDNLSGTLPATTGALNMYDGNPPTYDYNTPDLYWDSTTGIAATTNVASSGKMDYSMWSFCGQMSTYTVSDVNRYLAQMNAFETLFPQMRFILMTGHSDYPSTTLDINNNLVRAYAIANHKVLFDFADIERYDPDGVYHEPALGDAGGGCSWCAAYCTAHPAYCADLPAEGACAHTHSLLCKMKANAFWWMMARLAGWQP